MVHFQINCLIIKAILLIILIQYYFVCSEKTEAEIKNCIENINYTFGFQAFQRPNTRWYAKNAILYLRHPQISESYSFQNKYAMEYYLYLMGIVKPAELMVSPLQFCGSLRGQAFDPKAGALVPESTRCIGQISSIGIPTEITQGINPNTPATIDEKQTVLHFIYTHIVLEEMRSNDLNHARDYVIHVSDSIKLQDPSGRILIESPYDFCSSRDYLYSNENNIA